MTQPAPAPSPSGDRPAHGATQDALTRHRTALKERFPLPPEALGPLPAPPPARKRLKAGATAVAVLAAALAWLDPAWRTEHIATGPGQRLSIELADGTQVDLDTATRLRVSRHLRSRQVALEGGRALFDVAPSAWRPFSVQAGDTMVRVLGTAFDVRRRGPLGEDVLVTVLRGRVAVEGAAGEAAMLGPDDQLHAVAGKLAPAHPADTRASTAWREGRMVFERTPLPEVLAEIAHYGGLRIQSADDPALADLEVSGVYRTENARQLLALLPGFLPVRVQQSGHQVRVDRVTERNSGSR